MGGREALYDDGWAWKDGGHFTAPADHALSDMPTDKLAITGAHVAYEIVRACEQVCPQKKTKKNRSTHLESNERMARIEKKRRRFG